jgi:hypothetical protein
VRIAIFLVALMLCAFAAQSQQPSPRDHFQKAKQTRINQAQSEKPVAKAVQPPTSEPKVRSEWWLVWFTGALVFVAIVQAGVFYYQGRQLRETVKAARRNIDALMNAERAHLSFEHFEIVDERSPGQRFYPTVPGDANSPIAISVDLKNYGRTPATITTFWITPIVVETFQCIDLTHPHSTVTLAQPLAPSTADSRARYIALDEWRDVVAGRKTLVIYGHAEYRDIFGESHTSGFACAYIPPGPDQTEKFAAVCLDSHWYSD